MLVTCVPPIWIWFWLQNHWVSVKELPTVQGDSWVMRGKCFFIYGKTSLLATKNFLRVFVLCLLIVLILSVGHSGGHIGVSRPTRLSRKNVTIEKCLRCWSWCRSLKTIAKTTSDGQMKPHKAHKMLLSICWENYFDALNSSIWWIEDGIACSLDEELQHHITELQKVTKPKLKVS